MHIKPAKALISESFSMVFFSTQHVKKGKARVAGVLVITEVGQSAHAEVSPGHRDVR